MSVGDLNLDWPMYQCVTPAAPRFRQFVDSLRAARRRVGERVWERIFPPGKMARFLRAHCGARHDLLAPDIAELEPGLREGAGV